MNRRRALTSVAWSGLLCVLTKEPAALASSPNGAARLMLCCIVKFTDRSESTLPLYADGGGRRHHAILVSSCDSVIDSIRVGVIGTDEEGPSAVPRRTFRAFASASMVGIRIGLCAGDAIRISYFEGALWAPAYTTAIVYRRVASDEIYGSEWFAPRSGKP